MHLIGYLCSRLVCVAQFYFDASDEGTVNPVFGCDAACLADNGAQVALSEAHTLGIVAYLVFLESFTWNVHAYRETSTEVSSQPIENQPE